MKIDKAFLNNQISDFEKQREQLEANLNAITGAIQLCEYLLTVLKMKKPVEEKAITPEDLQGLLPPGATVKGLQAERDTERKDIEKN